MKFEDYFSAYEISENQMPNAPLTKELETSANGISEFFSRHAGTSFNQGIYRIHQTNEMQKWTQIALSMFSQFDKRMIVFSSDWLGRLYALDFERREDNQCLLLKLDASTGEAFEIPCIFQNFHHSELTNYSDEVLAEKYFQEWIEKGGKPPMITECVGYRHPLFLGGKDVLENLEISNMEVYWAICTQIINQIRNQPDAERIDKIQIKD